MPLTIEGARQSIRSALRNKQTTIRDGAGRWVAVIGVSKDKFENDDQDQNLLGLTTQTEKLNGSWFD